LSVNQAISSDLMVWQL